MAAATPVPVTINDKFTQFWDKLTDGKGVLSFNEFYLKLKKNGVTLSIKSLKKQWDILDVDNSDDMDLSEFRTLMSKHFEKTDPKYILQNAFNSIYKKLMPNVDHNDDLTSTASNLLSPRITSTNVAIKITSQSLKQNKKFQDALDKKLEAIFKIIDEDNSGTLEFDEMWQAVNLLEIPITENDLRLTFNFFDTDKNGHIEFDEFKRWMNSQVTRYWSDNPSNNQFLALQQTISKADVDVMSTKAIASKKAFSFPDTDAKDNDNNNNVNDANNVNSNDNQNSNNEFVNCTKSDVLSWDENKLSDFIGYIFRDTQYDQHRDKYITLFMTNLIDGKKFLKLDRRKLTRMGIENKKDLRHVSVLWNEIRTLKKQ